MTARAAGVLLLATLALTSARARADDAAPPRAEYWVDFEAGKVELDPELKLLALSEHVTIRVDRYRLTSERLTLRRTARGVELDGTGRVAFCRCPNAPVSFGFSRAIVAPPTDLFVEDATLRIDDVPVFWSPILWLRSPDRVGLLAPRVAWRGADGLLVGSGVHLPLGGRRGATLSALDVFGAGYLAGGVDLETRLTTPATTTKVRWDHLQHSLLSIDAHGSVAGRTGAVGAFRVDAIRGARGLEATRELEPATRRFDHARAAVGTSGGGFVGSFGAIGIGRRGDAIDAPAALGPLAGLGFGTALGAGASLDGFVHGGTLAERGEASISLVSEHTTLRADTGLGPLSLAVVFDQDASFWGREAASAGAVFAGARAALGLPLVRVFGDGPDPVVHRVEPLADLGVRVLERRGQTSAPAATFDELNASRVGLASLGVRSALGRRGAREAIELDARAGSVGELGADAPRPAAAALLAADGEWMGASTETAAGHDVEQELHSSARLRVGRVDGLHLSSYVAGSLANEPVSARALVTDHFGAPLTSYLDRPGWSAGTRLGVPWTRVLSTELGADADVTRARVLAWRAAIGYRHPCGCFSVLGQTGQRLGREGVDAEVTLDLMP